MRLDIGAAGHQQDQAEADVGISMELLNNFTSTVKKTKDQTDSVSVGKPSNNFPGTVSHHHAQITQEQAFITYQSSSNVASSASKHPPVSHSD